MGYDLTNNWRIQPAKMLISFLEKTWELARFLGYVVHSHVERLPSGKLT